MVIGLTAAVSTLVGTEPAQQGDAGGAGSLLGALEIVARHRGIHVSPTQLRRDNRIGPGEPSRQQMIELARISGLRAVATRLKFADLMRLGPALPVILLLKNGSAMVLRRA